ncbi:MULTISPECIES: glycosyltransferase family 2 protein [Kitasatospora]|uniref:Glycosyl transferase family 2 n=1 Tax=Kitasatospora griseola TaxID=2064 RepID=A0A0D0PJ13_KITGR|nr:MULTISPECIES: glycosyltransferase family 2 protein [Kitasatospora]KIQ62494.1 glycosyl transferase family 2 [Kitasatospora griseola]PJN24513.1 glycosyl transferase family 2 [Kitasatospora sp. CB02891]GGQ61904.1 hyaluronan synthase [Kitasatospora griseola]
MLAFLLQLRQWWTVGTIYPFAVFMFGIWMLWFVRLGLARRYRPWKRPYQVTTSVIIPVVDEPVDLFYSVLDRIIDQQPTEMVVVINGRRNEALEQVCDQLGVYWQWTEIPGKRNALKVGLEACTGDIAVLVDSDTIWTPTTLSELVKPFRDEKVGGVTTRQRILDPGRSVLTRWADWLESVRCQYSLPAMSVLGTVGCLPGRTIAFRRKILLDCMDDFLSEKFLGVFLEVSDDRTLTNYTLKQGYRTVYQSTSLVYTDAPLHLRKLTKQQYRWARGSQYNTLRMLPWMLRRTKMLALFYVVDIVVPFVLLGSFASWAKALWRHTGPSLYMELPLPAVHWKAITTILVLAAVMSVLSLAVRFGRHFAYRAQDLVYLPVFMVINTFILLPVRLLGFFRMGHNASWGTREDSFAGEKARSVKVVIPYLLGSALLVGSVMMSV